LGKETINKNSLKVADKEPFSSLCAVKAGVENNPTPQLVEKLIQRNLTGHQKSWIGVTAHEIGHLLGAGEVTFFMSRDVHSCSHWLRSRNPPPSPRIWAHIRGAQFVS
jgi:hypothetical protein